MIKLLVILLFPLSAFSQFIHAVSTKHADSVNAVLGISSSCTAVVSVGTVLTAQFDCVIATPEITTTAISSITTATAASGGVVTPTQNAIAAVGVCYTLHPTPNLTYDAHTHDGEDGTYASSLILLHPGTTYHVRAYMTDETGATYYGNELVFTTDFACGHDLDYAGRLYPTVQIGTQCWMTKNLNYGIYGDVDTRYVYQGPGIKWCYNNNQDNCDTYGGLYSMPGIPTDIPSGWHLPTEAQWQTLIDYVGSIPVATEAGYRLKATWSWSGGEGNNLVGFTALGAGRKSTLAFRWIFFPLTSDPTLECLNDFEHLGTDAYFWTSTVAENGVYKHVEMSSASNSVSIVWETCLSGDEACLGHAGYSIRLVKD